MRRGGDLCGRGDVRCEGREEGGSCCRGRGYSPQRREGREEEPFMVMGEENFTAKAQRAQRKQLMLTGVECSPRRREGREEGVHAYG